MKNIANLTIVAGLLMQLPNLGDYPNPSVESYRYLQKKTQRVEQVSSNTSFIPIFPKEFTKIIASIPMPMINGVGIMIVLLLLLAAALLSMEEIYLSILFKL